MHLGLTLKATKEGPHMSLCFIFMESQHFHCLVLLQSCHNAQSSNIHGSSHPFRTSLFWCRSSIAMLVCTVRDFISLTGSLVIQGSPREYPDAVDQKKRNIFQFSLDQNPWYQETLCSQLSSKCNEAQMRYGVGSTNYKDIEYEQM